MGKMKELYIEGRNTENYRKVVNLAEAAQRLVKEVEGLLAKPSLGQNYNIEGLVYATDGLKGEAAALLKELKG